MRRTPLKRVGRRQRRLQAGDRRQERDTHALPCVCGCGDQVDRAHLETRRYESTRNEVWNNLPLCRLAHRWLDQETAGVRCRKILKALALEKGDRLTSEEAGTVMSKHGYWLWRSRQLNRR